MSMTNDQNERCENEVRKGRRGQWERCMHRVTTKVTNGVTTMRVCNRCMKEKMKHGGMHPWTVVE